MHQSVSYAPTDAVPLSESDPQAWRFVPHYSDRVYHREADDYDVDRAHVPQDFDSVAGSSVSSVSLRSKLADRRRRRRQRERDRGGSHRMSSPSRGQRPTSRGRSLGRRNGRYVLEAVDSSEEEGDGDRDDLNADHVGYAAHSEQLEPDRAMLVLLAQLGLSHHTQRVVGLGCSSLRHLLDLTPSDMQAIGMAPLEARRLAQSICALRGDVPSSKFAVPEPSPTSSSMMYRSSSIAVGPMGSAPPSVGAPNESNGAERAHGGAFDAVMRFAEKLGDDELLSKARSAHSRGI